ncbi:hypothetical protein E0K89_019705 [Aquicoccus sp. SCR17]|nr:hypothetical protein [Carideicomes alvinocaridis]
MKRAASCLLPAVALAAAGAPAMAEGARLSLDCDFVTACSEDGTCGEGRGPVRFELAPKETDAAGAGSYAVTVDEGETMAAEGLSRTGPFLWQPSDGTRMVLTLTSGTTALWVRQVTETGTDAPPSAEIDLMTCEIVF